MIELRQTVLEMKVCDNTKTNTDEAEEALSPRTSCITCCTLRYTGHRVRRVRISLQLEVEDSFESFFVATRTRSLPWEPGSFS